MPRKTAAALMEARGMDPATLRPALRHQRGRLADYLVRCWVRVDGDGAVVGSVGTAVRRRRGDAGLTCALVLGKTSSGYELED